MSNAPAAGVAAGPSRGQSTSVPLGWTPAPRSALLALAIMISLVGWPAKVNAAEPAVSAPLGSLGLRATYDVKASIRWAKRTILVSTTARVTNTTDEEVKQLTFNLVPLPVGQAEVLAVTVDDEPVTAIVKGQSLIVPLPAPLQPDRRTRVTIIYRAQFNTTRVGKHALLMKKDGVLTAYRWIPWLSRVQRFRTPNLGDTWVTPVSPRVTVKLKADVPLTFATTGRQIRVDGRTQTFSARYVRDFNFAASRHYQVERLRWHDTTISVYYRHRSPDELTAPLLAALEQFSDRLGRYPYRGLSVAETPVESGMESPALTWISSSVDPSKLERLLVHEIAHQWFYAVVGSDQATDPYLEEALADFLMRSMLDAFRASGCGKARLDLTVYEYGAYCYPEIVYVQGSQYLERYRQQVGDEAFWRGLRRFYRDQSFGIADTRSLFDALDAASGFDSDRHARRFPRLYP